MGSRKGEDHRKDLDLRGHTAADIRQEGTRRVGNHVHLVVVHTQQVGSQVEVGMSRILLVAVDTHVGEDNLVVAGTGHMEVPHIHAAHAAHGTQTGPYLDSAKSKQSERERVSIDTHTVDDSRTYKGSECSKTRPPKPLVMRLPGEGACTTLRHSKERQRRAGFVKLGQFSYV